MVDTKVEFLFLALATFVMACLLSGHQAAAELSDLSDDDKALTKLICGGDLFKLFQHCRKYVKKDEEQEDPSEECCDEVQKTDLACICQYIPPIVERYISMEKLAHVAEKCEQPLPSGTKCGSYTVPTFQLAKKKKASQPLLLKIQEERSFQPAKKVSPPPPPPKIQEERSFQLAKKVSPPPPPPKIQEERSFQLAKKVSPPPPPPKIQEERSFQLAKKVSPPPPPKIQEERSFQLAKKVSPPPPPPKIQEERSFQLAKKVSPPPPPPKIQEERSFQLAKKVSPPPKIQEERKVMPPPLPASPPRWF